MHKFFAKTLFLGKKVIFLPECHSTNESLSALCKKEQVAEGALLWSDYQSKGRGQRGNLWESNRGDNILGSILIKPRWLPLEQQFMLTFISGLAIREALQEFIPDTVKVKWPNDIYVGNKKIAGILTEASISGRYLDSAVVGFGININQKKFHNPHATSVAKLIGDYTDRETVLELVVEKLEKYVLKLKSGNNQELQEEYYQNMLGYHEIRTFEHKGKFQGEIVGVDHKGHLQVRVQSSDANSLSEGAIASFGLKEISMIV